VRFCIYSDNYPSLKHIPASLRYIKKSPAKKGESVSSVTSWIASESRRGSNAKKLNGALTRKSKENPLTRNGSGFRIFGFLQLVGRFSFPSLEMKRRALRLLGGQMPSACSLVPNTRQGGIKHEPSLANWANEANPWPAECRRNE